MARKLAVSVTNLLIKSATIARPNRQADRSQRCGIETERSLVGAPTLQLLDRSVISSTKRRLFSCDARIRIGGESQLTIIMAENRTVGSKEELLRALLSQEALNRQNLQPHEYLRSDVQIFEDQILGQGAFSKVVLANLREKSGKRARIVAKTPAEENLTEASTRLHKEIMAEYNIMRRCGFHPYILQAIGVTNDIGKVPLLLLEYVDKGTDIGKIRQRLFNTGEDIDIQTKTRWLFEICRGGDYLHGLNIIHRDVAARNVIVGQMANGNYGIAKLADFGLAREVGENGIYEAALFEPFPLRSTAPEALQRPIWTKACDVWAVGVTIWEVFHPNPFEKPYALFVVVNRQIMRNAIVEQNVRLHLGPKAPESIIEIMNDCFTLDNRPSMMELAERFRQSHEDLSISIIVDQE